ncbi:MAG: hypothetical protein NTY35_04160 [Planctomycetota bacterium]|nr:hypothetical protein [Planctomycetota bacterium]
MSPMRDEDFVLAGRFVDGELGEPERTRFELRLSAEPDLAQEVERLMRTDELVRREAERAAASRASGTRGEARAVDEVSRRRSRFRLLTALALAAATVLAVLGLRSLLHDGPDRSRTVEVALAPSFESAREWIARDPDLADQRPPGLDDLRGANEAPNVDARAFVEAARRVESRAFGASQPAEMTATFYALPVRATEASFVLVFAFPSRGTPLRHWPEGDPARLEAARIEAGDHVLPGPSFRLVDDPRGARVEYQRGFLVPIGAGRLEIVVASRPASGADLDPALLVPGPDAAATRARLAAAGFDTRTLFVREP